MNFKLTKGNIFNNRVIEDLIQSIIKKKKKVNYLEIKVIYAKKN